MVVTTFFSRSWNAISASHVLQESREGRAGEHGESLLESLDLIITGCLPELKILKCEITALVEVCVLVGKLLQLTHHALMLGLGFDLLLLSLGLHITLGND